MCSLTTKPLGLVSYVQQFLYQVLIELNPHERQQFTAAIAHVVLIKLAALAFDCHQGINGYG